MTPNSRRRLLTLAAVIGAVVFGCGQAGEGPATDSAAPRGARALGPDWPLSGVLVADPIQGPVGPGRWSELQLTDARTVRDWNTTLLDLDPDPCTTDCRAQVIGWRHQVPLSGSAEPELFGPQWAATHLAHAEFIPNTSEGPLWKVLFTTPPNGADSAQAAMYCAPQANQRLRCRWAREQLLGPAETPAVATPPRTAAVWWLVYDSVAEIAQPTDAQALERYLLAGQGR